MSRLLFLTTMARQRMATRSPPMAFQGVSLPESQTVYKRQSQGHCGTTQATTPKPIELRKRPHSFIILNTFPPPGKSCRPIATAFGRDCVRAQSRAN